MPTGETGHYLHPAAGTTRFSYRNDDEATTRAWHDDAFTVGDIGYLDEDGYLTITDRVSDMVLWGGVNIAPREIEEVLFEHPAVVDCAVFGIPDAAGRRAAQGDGAAARQVTDRRAGRPSSAPGWPGTRCPESGRWSAELPRDQQREGAQAPTPRGPPGAGTGVGRDR